MNSPRLLRAEPIGCQGGYQQMIWLKSSGTTRENLTAAAEINHSPTCLSFYKNFIYLADSCINSFSYITRSLLINQNKNILSYIKSYRKCLIPVIESEQGLGTRNLMHKITNYYLFGRYVLVWFYSPDENPGNNRIQQQYKIQIYQQSLQWRHNGRDSVSNHPPHDCLLNHLFKRRSKKTSKLRVTGLCAGNSPVTGEFTAQIASDAENASIWWRHHAKLVTMFQKSKFEKIKM